MQKIEGEALNYMSNPVSMGTYIHGWRRKAGCVALMMACLFASGWIRSFRHMDRITIGFGSVAISASSWDTVVGIRLGHQSLGRRNRSEWISRGLELRSVNPTIYRFEDPMITGEIDVISWIARVNRFGLGFTPSTSWRSECQIFVVTPYWTVVIPLTLISAWFLLSKPRNSGPLASA